MPKLFEGLFGAPSKSVSSTPTAFGTLPGFGKEGFEDVIGRGTELSQDPGLFAPAGLTPDQLASLSTLRGGLQQTSPEAFGAGLSTFQNPFEEQVVQNALRDIREQGAGLFSDIGTAASAAGGFGGERQALLESELQQNILRESGDVSGRLRSQGFQSAADRAIADIGRTQDVAGNLFQFGETGRQIQTGQQQAPLSALSFLQDLLKGLPVGGGGSSVSTGARQSVLEPIGKLAGGLGGFGAGFGFGG